MVTLPSWWRTIVGFVLLGTAGGCGAAKVTRSPVHGTVSYRGSTLACGTIVFTPDASRGHDGTQARGEIKPDGSYTLETNEGAGAVPGWYRITVMAVEMPDRAPEGQPYPMPRSLLPPRYRDPELAGLVREVKPGGDNRIDLDLD